MGPAGRSRVDAAKCIPSRNQAGRNADSEIDDGGYTGPMPKRTAASLLFVGFNRRVVAMHRKTGEIAWQWKAPRGTGFVALLPDDDLLFASVDGYTYALDPATGDLLWENPLAGLGTGVPCLATLRGTSGASGGAAETQRLEQQRRSAHT